MKECLMYVFTGFLESGKTSLIQETLQDPGFQSDEKNLIILCEDGETTYEAAWLKDVHGDLVKVDSFDTLTAQFLEACEAKYQPDRVLVEFNGMWSVDQFLDIEFPLRWILVQILSTVDASTFELYLTNMRSVLYEQFRHSETIIFNRCDETTRKRYLRNNIKAMNRVAQIIYEDKDGTINRMGEDTMPFSIEDDEIELSDYDYGIWYMDALDHPDQYEGKIVSYNAKVYPVEQRKQNGYVLGREAMVCCSDDTSLIGWWVFTKQGLPAPNQWLHIRGKIRVEFDADYGGNVCVIEELDRTPIEHADEYVYFT